MSRDVRNLRVFHLADRLVLEIYAATRSFPDEERFGLKAQLRRAALSIPVNIVEGSARRSLKEYVNFLNVATGSSAEVEYLLSVTRRLKLVPSERGEALEALCKELLKGLRALVRELDAMHARH